MNERIRELAKQCYETGPIGKDGWPEHSKLNEEKFAELIVRECIKVVDDTMTENQEMNIGLVMASAAIVAHFGVEERKIIPIHSEIEPHPCPYKMEIHDDFDTLCTCDESQEHECAMDV